MMSNRTVSAASGLAPDRGGEGRGPHGDSLRTDPDDLWSALTDPERLARWIVRVTAIFGRVVPFMRASPAVGKVQGEWTCASRRGGSW